MNDATPFTQYEIAPVVSINVGNGKFECQAFTSQADAEAAVALYNIGSAVVVWSLYGLDEGREVLWLLDAPLQERAYYLLSKILGRVIPIAEPGRRAYIDVVVEPAKPETLEEINARISTHNAALIRPPTVRVDQVSTAGTPRTFEVWTHGYQATGDYAPATFHGAFSGVTFREAVLAFVATLSPDSHKFFNEKSLALGGCRFYDNEKDARRFCG